ncbi:amidohydrolase family protein [Deinococcus ruber]|uniref:Amidohydrolase n=1 Tax=Deinococcus ruber TaxID=1848197 RepID=A0A918FCY5_9DEIO|nr:amidohydrolase family protein [Deinococcus ruber]GGR23044.1 amidohydrolase [Deinococcus ruber]
MTSSSSVLIRNIHVVDTRTGASTPQRSVLIEHGRIRRITDSGEMASTGTEQEIDGTGKYLVPGYLDMHVHAVDEAQHTPGIWNLFLAHRVTGVRQMSGSPATLARSRHVNAERAAGTLDAPEVLMTPGGLFMGQASDEAGGRAFVRQQKALGTDFVKVVGGNREATLGILDEARVQGLTVAGHLMPALTAQESSDYGYHAVEHLGAGLGFLLDCSPQSAQIRRDYLVGGTKPPFPPTYVLNPRAYDGAQDAPFYQRVLDTFDDALCEQVLGQFAARDVWQVPTLIRIRTQDYGDAAEYRNDPNLKYLDPETRALWQHVGDDFAKIPSGAAHTLQRYYDLQRRVTGMMSEAGVKMLAGSDVGGIWLIPGHSLHQEFRELAASGLTPLEILQTTSLNGAVFAGRQDDLGTVEEGKVADLVLLEADPLSNAANLEKIGGLLLNGRYFSKADLERRKAQGSGLNLAGV